MNHIAFTGGSPEYLDKIYTDFEASDIEILKRKEACLCFQDPNNVAVEVYAKENE